METQIRPSGRPIVDWFDEPYVLRDVDGDTIGDIVEVNPDFIVVETDGVQSADELKNWVQQGVTFAQSLPPK